MRPDPYGQHWSPYLAMGNNWVNIVDPNGGWDGKGGFNKSEYYFRTDYDQRTYVLDYALIGLRDFQKISSEWDFDPVGEVWNNSSVGKIIPDAIYINYSTSLTTVEGRAISDGFIWAIKGENGGQIWRYSALSETVGGQVGIGDNVGYCSYTGDSRNFSLFKHFEGTSSGAELDILKVGVGRSTTSFDEYGFKLFNYDASFGGGFGVNFYTNTTTKLHYPVINFNK